MVWWSLELWRDFGSLLREVTGWSERGGKEDAREELIGEVISRGVWDGELECWAWWCCYVVEAYWKRKDWKMEWEEGW